MKHYFEAVDKDYAPHKHPALKGKEFANVQEFHLAVSDNLREEQAEVRKGNKSEPDSVKGIVILVEKFEF